MSSPFQYVRYVWQLQLLKTQETTRWWNLVVSLCNSHSTGILRYFVTNIESKICVAYDMMR
jgi:hypothetical protein